MHKTTYYGPPGMPKSLLIAVTFFAVVGLVVLLYQLTLDEADPCAAPQADTSAAILADEAGDQDALANRAILMRGNCESSDDNND